MYRFAKRLSNKMARVGHLCHSGRPALQGGENVCGGKGYFSPRDFVSCWMKSPQHRAWLLDPRVKAAAVGISASRRGSYAAWSFSDQPLFHPRYIRTGILGWLYKLFHTTYWRWHWNPWNRRDYFLMPHRPEILTLILKTFTWLTQLLAIGLILLGVHGLWVYFSRVEAVGENMAKLFLAIQMPAWFQNIVEWVSMQGVNFWLVPAAFIAGGVLLWYSPPDRVLE